MRRQLLRGAPLLASLVVLAGGGSGAAASTTASTGETQGHPQMGQPGITESVAEIMARQRAKDRRTAGEPQRIREAPEPGERPPPSSRADEGAPQPSAPARPDGGPKTPFTVGTNFLGIQLSGESTSVPPDSMGSVGPTQIVVAANGRIKVFDKQGNLGPLNVSDTTFWNSVRNGFGTADPEVEYDRLSGRWILSQINVQDPNNRIMIAVSSGPTITAQTDFTFYFFDSFSGVFADYPQMGVDKNAIYIGVNNFAPGYVGSDGFVVRKSSILSGGPIVVTNFHNIATGSTAGPFAPQGVQNMDPNVDEGYFIGVDSLVFSQLDIRRVTDPGGTPSISGNLNITVPTTRFPLDVPAQGTSTTLDALDDRLFEAMIGRKPDNSLSLWTAHNIKVNSSGVGSDTGDRTAARWYEITNLSSTPSLVQSGTQFDPGAAPARYFWIPSIAANGQGHASLNSSTAGVGRFAEIASMGRLASDPLGTTQAFTIAQSSTSPYDITVTNPQRWGDYSQTVVDPTDNMTFWTFQEYAAPLSNNWGVRVIELKAPPPATPSSASPPNVPQGSPSTSVTITGTSSSGSGFFDPGPDTGGPGFPNHISASVSGGVTVNSVTFTDPTHVTLDLDTTGATTGLKDVTITNPDDQSATGNNLITVETDTTPPDTIIDSAPHGTTDDPTPTFDFHSTEAGSTFQCAIDTGTPSFGACSGPGASHTPPSPLADGTYTFRVRATDPADNIDPSPATEAFTVDSAPPSPPGPPPFADNDPPETTITKGPKDKTKKKTATFEFSSSEPGSSFECTLDGQTNFKPCTSPLTVKVKKGKHTLQVRATANGQTDATPASDDWKVKKKK